MSAPHTEKLLVCLRDLAPRSLDWVWPGRLARGKLCLLDGDPGQGKSLLTLDLCARLTRGDPFPDGAPSGPPVNVLLLTGEDDARDTVCPRLAGFGAALDRVHVPEELLTPGEAARLLAFPRDGPLLEQMIRRSESRLVVIDPFMAFLDRSVCGLNDQSVRQVLTPLAQVAERTGCAILLIRHLIKVGGLRALYRGSGSIGIMGAVRSALVLARDPDDADIRVLACTKSNFGPLPPALAFGIVTGPGGAPELVWLGESDLRADDLMAAASVRLWPRERARAFLQERLKTGECEVHALFREARDEGIAAMTLRRAKRELKVEVRQQPRPGQSSVFFWSLPQAPRDPTAVVLDQLLPPLNLADLAVGQLDLSQ
jgi:hypothetical protein